ncbi:pilus assembly protein [Sphingomonas koreensis]|nr:pilus assembly protein [Sphingomonas koreensis]
MKARGHMSKTGFVKNLARDRRALGAVEFAMTAPFLILLYIGGYQLMDAISAYRKVTITTRTLADLITRTPATTPLTPSNVQTILDASRQIMMPFSVGNATLRITAINIDENKKATVAWSKASDGNVNSGSNLAVPTKLKVANTSVIFSEATYHYTPVVGGKLVGPLVFKDQIYMNPRNASSIPCPQC